jgi:transcriptional regulator with XRE-family HTH domain
MNKQLPINERIKAIRLQLHMSQREFAKAVYVSHGYISEVEIGHKEANERLIHLVSNAFSVNKHWLLTGEGRVFNDTPEEKIKRLASLFSELYPEYQDYVLRQIDELIALQNTRGEKEKKG